MTEHETRVVKEKEELDIKLNALELFIESGTFDKLPCVDRQWLSRQLYVMTLYTDILGERIELFKE